MATNELLPFASGAGANVLTQAQYVADSQRTSGNVPGVARSALVNKAARQAAFVASMVGAFTSNNSGKDVLDNGDGATFLANFQDALLAYMRANAATETLRGVVRLATNAEAQGWGSDAGAITPLKLSQAFKGANQTLTNQGIQRFPGGLILQWGETNITNTGNINFPTAFPNAVLNVKANAMSAVDSTTTSSCFVEMAIRSAGQIWVKLIQADGNLGSRGVQWLALGW
ncbi:gp53-like domain-containing protein [Achromobacter ruhlandii]|uniref:gp53-like domain-containing protein n=1 Tax=Achromobacter ruhlandii TaxID=72557 RepID=UPI0012FD19EE|nr:hypothetical protein [Achromobacter ruhlandii]